MAKRRIRLNNRNKITMETNTSSPTPSEDNRQNSRDDLMYSALDKVMNNSEQTYEDFLSSFTYLKQGLKEKHNQQGKVTAALKNLTQKERKADSIKETGRGNIKDLPKDYKGEICQLSEDIEEEVLIEGDSSSRLTQTKVIRTGTLVKFDNFVANSVDDVGELTEESCEGYTASFSAGNFGRGYPGLGMVSHSSPSEKEQNSNKLQDNAAAANADVSINVDTPMSLDENSTDILLMNFLADLQNELNEGKTNEKLEIEDTNSCMDIQNFLSKNKNQKKLATEYVNFDDDDENDTMNLLQDDSETRQIKVKITEEELNEQVEFDDAEEKERKARLGNIYRDTLMDSEGKITTKPERGREENQGVNEEVNLDNIIFPGQVEERKDFTTSENDTFLDFKATYSDRAGSSETQVEITDNFIVPFKLDEDFDYDSVVLTPKFSSQELQKLKQNIKAQTVVM